MQNRITIGSNFIVILAVVLVGLLDQTSVVAAPPDPLMQLRVTGPAGQWVSLAIRCFKGDEQQSRWTTNQQRVQLVDGVAVVPLEKNYDGYAVDVFNPSEQALNIELRQGDDVLNAKPSVRVGHTIVRSGTVKALDTLIATDISLTAADRETVSRFLAAFDRADTESIVSAANTANIDWPSLNAFAGLVGEVLGTRDDELAGWVKWPGTKDSTVFAGRLRYQRGAADVVLVMLDEKLVDFVLSSESLPKHWHTGNAAITEYAQRGASLIRLMFAGELAKAHAIFSARVHDQITIEKLLPVHNTLVGQFGDSVKSIELRDHRLEATDSENDQKLMLTFDLITSRDVVCEGTVEVFLDHINGPVPRGHIASFNVKEKGPSIPVGAKQKVESILSALSQGDPSSFKQQLSEQMQLYLLEEQLDGEIDRWQRQFGRIETEIDWSQWSDTPGKKGIEGPVSFVNSKAKVRVDFGTNNIIGVTIVGEKYAGSTLDCVKENKPLTEHALLFWRHLFSKEFDAAYEMLPAVFRQQLSRDQFLKMTGSLAKVDAELSDVSVRSLRFDTKPDRVSATMIEIICLLKFANGSLQTARCEYHVTGPDKFDLYTFNTEFAEEFPVPFSDHTDFLAAIASGNGDRVLALFHPMHRKQIDLKVLQALLLEIRKQWGGLVQSDVNGIAIRRYENSSDELTKVTAELTFDNATVPTEWTYAFGHLKSFHFLSGEIAKFAKNIEDTSDYRSRSEQLFKHWFDGEVRDALELLMPELHKQESLTRMTELKQRVGQTLGQLKSITFESESFNDENHSLQQEFLLDFSKGQAKGTATFAFDALHSLIVGANISRLDQAPKKEADSSDTDSSDTDQTTAPPEKD